MTSLTWLDALWQDLRFGARTLRKTPGFTAIAIFTLALGIGASTAVFSLIDAVLLRVAPYANPQQLVFIFTPVPRLLPMINSMVASTGASAPMEAYEVFGPSVGDFNDVRAQGRSFSSIAAYNNYQANLSTNGLALRAHSTDITGDFFTVFGASPERGRAISRDDERPGSEHVAVISHALWVTRFGSDPAVLGKSVSINSKPFRIVGIMPASFQFPFDGDLDIAVGRQNPTDIWLSWQFTEKDLADYSWGNANVVARMRPGVSAAQAQSEVYGIVSRNDAKRDAMLRGAEAVVTPFAHTLNQSTERPLLLLLGAVALVLLIACSNAAGLLMARAAARLHEFSVRAALGARRSRLIRQLLTESVLLATAAAAFGIFLAYAAIRAVIILSPGNTPRLENARLNGAVLLFTLALAFLTSILFGLLPALSVSRVHLAEFIQSAAGRTVKGASRRLHEALILVEVALCVVLLAGSGLFIRSLQKALSVDKGFQPEAILTARISLHDRYSTPEKQRGFFQSAVAQIGKLPGVSSVAAASNVPLDNSESLTFTKVEDHPYDAKVPFESRSVGPNYFSTLGIPVLQGREFAATDDPKHPPVVVVNRYFAQTYFPNGAIGKHIWGVGLDGKQSEGPGQTIVGVVPDVHQFGLEGAPVMQLYFPLWQGGQDHVTIVARTTVPPAALVPRIREAVAGLDPALPVDDTRTMYDRITAATAARRFQTVILTSFAGIALFLSLVGLYALMAYSVRQRTSEIGVRMALGAQPSDLLRMVLRRGLILALIGAAAGIAIALASSRVVERFLFGVSALDPLTLAAAIALLLAVALLACLIPALRAARIDPMLALRHE
jgi:predicted permease